MSLSVVSQLIAHLFYALYISLYLPISYSKFKCLSNIHFIPINKTIHMISAVIIATITDDEKLLNNWSGIINSIIPEHIDKITLITKKATNPATPLFLLNAGNCAAANDK